MGFCHDTSASPKASVVLFEEGALPENKSGEVPDHSSQLGAWAQYKASRGQSVARHRARDAGGHPARPREPLTGETSVPRVADH